MRWIIAVADRSVCDLSGTIASLSDHLSKVRADGAAATSHFDDPITVGKHICSREDAPMLLVRQLVALLSVERISN